MGRGGGFDNGVVDSVPNLIVRSIVEDCIKERLNSVEIKIVGGSSRTKSEEIASEAVTTCSRKEQACNWE